MVSPPGYVLVFLLHPAQLGPCYALVGQGGGGEGLYTGLPGLEEDMGGADMASEVLKGQSTD